MDETGKKRASASRCIVKAIMMEKVDPNEISIEAIHASSIRLITNFIQRPSPDLAAGVVKMLDALAKHDDAFKTDSGYNIYQQASLMWQAMLDNMSDPLRQNSSEHIIH